MSAGEAILKSAEERMKKSIDSFQEELKTIRTGRPNPEIFKKVRIECYGSMMGLSDVSTISVPDGKSFLIQPFDKGNLKAIETSIQNSDLGLNPSNDGTVIRIPVPPLSKERRDELTKQVGKVSETEKIAIRNIRQDSKDKLKKLKDESVSEDEIKKLQDKLEKLTAKYTGTIDEITKKKEAELQAV